MCIEFGKDIGLLDTEAPGVQGQYTIQIQMDATNQSTEPLTIDFYQVFMMEGTFSISENMGRASLGNLTPDVVLASKLSDELHYDDYESLSGGGFASKLKHFVNKVARGVQTGAKIAGAVAPVLGSYGAPIGAAARGVGMVAGGTRALSGGRLAGGRLAGGSVMSRRAMKKRY